MNNKVKHFRSTCRICEKQFEYESVNQRFYCDSVSCRNEQKRRAWAKHKSVKKANVSKTKECNHCKKEFILDDKQIKTKRPAFCSEECRIARKREQTRVWRIKLRGKKCQAEIIPPKPFLNNQQRADFVRMAKNDVANALRRLGL